MNNRLIPRNVIVVLSCCAITLLGGWIGNLPSSPVVRNGYPVRHSGTADSVFPVVKWDSTGWTGRVVVGEYFTGVYCMLCQAHDYAFDSLLKRYPTTAFIPLGVHMTSNFPISSPDDSLLQRVEFFYGNGGGNDDSYFFPQKTDSNGGYEWDNWIDGHGTRNGSIGEMYKAMADTIDADLRKAPEAVLHAEATPHGGTITAKVQVTSLSSPHSDVLVRMLIVEDPVNLEVTDTSYKVKTNEYGETYIESAGENLLLSHRMVVRAASRDGKYPLGSLLHGTGTVSYTFDMAKLQTRSLHYWKLLMGKVKPKTKFERAQMLFFGVIKPKTEHEKAQMRSLGRNNSDMPWKSRKNWTMDPTKLSLVAFVQDLHTGEVLQAQMIPVNAGPHGELLKLP